jgi:hypothetical protein
MGHRDFVSFVVILSLIFAFGSNWHASAQPSALTKALREIESKICRSFGASCKAKHATHDKKNRASVAAKPSRTSVAAKPSRTSVAAKPSRTNAAKVQKAFTEPKGMPPLPPQNPFVKPVEILRVPLPKIKPQKLATVILPPVVGPPTRLHPGGPLTIILEELAPAPSNQALRQIPDLGRKLLALRIYLRTGSRLKQRWSWTDEQIKAFQGSAEQQALLAEVAAVSTYFAQANPSFQIYVNTNIRSLDAQIRSWNSNESVGVAADEILSKWKDEFGTEPQAWAKLDSKKVRIWLKRFDGTNRANIAAPGLSFHGQARAIDFQVMQNGTIIASTYSKQIDHDWRTPKWDIKLRESISAAGPSFRGPLTSPDEPWHYEYDPGNRSAVKDNSVIESPRGVQAIK